MSGQSDSPLENEKSPHLNTSASNRRAPWITAWAVVAFIFGILSFCIPFFAGFAAIISGMIACGRVNGHPDKFYGKGLAILSILLAVCTTAFWLFFPPLRGHGEIHGRATCDANLTGIMKACLIYAQENNGQFPLTVPSLPVNSKGTIAYTGWSGSAPTYNAKTVEELVTNYGPGNTGRLATTAINNPTASLWLLVMRGMVSPKGLICKSDPWTEASASLITDANGNFYQYPQRATQISYSLAFPWNTTGTGPAPYWKETGDAELPLMSDMALRQAPGDDVTMTTGKKINSPNHNGEGQNVGFADAHVEWIRNPTQAHPKSNDSIFHYGGWNGTTFDNTQRQSTAGIKLSAPPTGYDIYMVPQRDASGKMW